MGREEGFSGDREGTRGRSTPVQHQTGVRGSDPSWRDEDAAAMSDPYADSEDEGLRDRVASQASEAEEAAREGAAEGLHRGAATVRERTEDMGGRAGEAGVRVADTMERTAGYLREHDTAAIWNDLERMIREHPKQAVAGAVVAGLIIGRLMR